MSLFITLILHENKENALLLTKKVFLKYQASMYKRNISVALEAVWGLAAPNHIVTLAQGLHTLAAGTDLPSPLLTMPLTMLLKSML